MAWNASLKIRHGSVLRCLAHSYTTPSVIGAPRGLSGIPTGVRFDYRPCSIPFSLACYCRAAAVPEGRSAHAGEFLGPG